MNNNMTKAWEYYEAGRAYNNSLVPNQYRLVNSNIEFFTGNQWVHLRETPAMNRLPRPTFNILKRVVSLFVASLTSSAVAINFSPLAYYSDDGEAAAFATSAVRNLLEKFKMNYRIREALFDGAQTGDYCAHFFFDPSAKAYGGGRGEIQMELVDGINVMFGNPNTPDVESQPYIIIVGRNTVEHLKAEAKHYARYRQNFGKGRYHDGIEDPQPDADFADQAGVGGRTELPYTDDANSKALYLYLYTKVTTEETVTGDDGLPVMEQVLDSQGSPIPERRDGSIVLGPDGTPLFKQREMKRLVTSVHVTKATKDFNIFEDVDTGLSRYPIAWGNWEKQKNQYHGRALVTGIIPNQIFINTMFAMVMRHLQLQAFPKTVYNADLISHWNNEIGVAIGIHGLQPNQRVGDMAMNLQPADMSNQIIMALDKAMAYTKDCLGATDAQLGSARAENTSALMVLQASSAVPLENTRAGLHEWVENIGDILLDMMGTYYGERSVVRDREVEEMAVGPDGNTLVNQTTGLAVTNRVTRRVVEDFDFSVFKDISLMLDVDVGASTYYSEVAMVQTLDNLRRDGMLDIVSYLERVPEKLIPRKQELIDALKARTQMQAAAGEQELVMPGAEATPGGMPPPGTDGGLPIMGGPLDTDKAISHMPTDIQGRFDKLPNIAKKTVLQKAEIDR